MKTNIYERKLNYGEQEAYLIRWLKRPKNM